MSMSECQPSSVAQVLATVGGTKAMALGASRSL